MYATHICIAYIRYANMCDIHCCKLQSLSLREISWAAINLENATQIRQGNSSVRPWVLFCLEETATCLCALAAQGKCHWSAIASSVGAWFRIHDMWTFETPFATQSGDQRVNHSAMTHPSKTHWHLLLSRYAIPFHNFNGALPKPPLTLRNGWVITSCELRGKTIYLCPNVRKK